jgi:uncharacterized membrane protein YgaE (UPF0421/DUF939 family)
MKGKNMVMGFITTTLGIGAGFMAGQLFERHKDKLPKDHAEMVAAMRAFAERTKTSVDQTAAQLRQIWDEAVAEAKAQNKKKHSTNRHSGTRKRSSFKKAPA